MLIKWTPDNKPFPGSALTTETNYLAMWRHWNQQATITWTNRDDVIRCRVASPVKTALHDDVIIWKHFPHNWPFVWRIHRWPVNSLHKGQWLGALEFSFICARINGWVNRGVGWGLGGLVIWDAITLIMTSLWCILLCNPESITSVSRF